MEMDTAGNWLLTSAPYSMTSCSRARATLWQMGTMYDCAVKGGQPKPNGHAILAGYECARKMPRKARKRILRHIFFRDVSNATRKIIANDRGASKERLQNFK